VIALFHTFRRWGQVDSLVFPKWVVYRILEQRSGSLQAAQEKLAEQNIDASSSDDRSRTGLVSAALASSSEIIAFRSS
jgi:hypothetical protein